MCLCKMGVCNVLLTVCEAAFENLSSGLKSNRRVGDFQVATRGGFWVATRAIRDEQHKLPYDAEEEQVTRFINAISSLIYDDSKIKSLETIGKMLEPQIKFYFEF